MSHEKHVVEKYIFGELSKDKIAKCYDSNPDIILPFISDYIVKYHNEIEHILMDLFIYGYMHDHVVIIPYGIIQILLLFYGNLFHQKAKHSILLHHQLTAFCESCDENTDKLSESINNTFQTILHSDTLLMVNGLLFYIHHITTKGKHVTDYFIHNEIKTEDIINNIIQMISYLDDNHSDLFFNAFQKDLSVRLIASKSKSEEDEYHIISKLNEHCFGYHKISKLKDMLKDIQRSKDLMISYFKHNNITSDIELNIISSTIGAWPRYNELKIKPPMAIKQVCDEFLNRYLYKYSGRRLNFIMDEGTAELAVQFNAKTKKIAVVSTLQMCILLLFNHQNTITFQQILSELEYSDNGDIINDALLSMAHPKIKILRKAPNTKDLQIQHKFQINPKYVNARCKIHIPTLKFSHQNEKYLYQKQSNFQWGNTRKLNERVRILRWNGFAVWRYNVIGDVCAICTNKIHELCIECQGDPNITSRAECTLAWGVCNHQFHFHCIARWLKKHGRCPMDNKEWEFQIFDEL